MTIWNDINTKTPGVKVKQAMRIVPARQRTPGPRSGQHLDAIARKAGDCFWRCSVEVAKVIYQKIDARYPNRTTNANDREVHRVKMDEAKKNLQENRNLIFEAVLPMFTVEYRHPADDFTEADVHARDYFLNNCFTSLVRTYKAWMPEFVAEEDVAITEKVVDRVAAFQFDKMDQELRNFRFGFRPVAKGQ